MNGNGELYRRTSHPPTREVASVTYEQETSKEISSLEGGSHSPHELERLATLGKYDTLDAPASVAFERLTQLAAQFFAVPIALITFVDAERQWFKACVGMNSYHTERELSFCAYTILSREVMVVPDATMDARFKDNALVTGSPHIRFYAGAPLKMPNGHILGSFCIIDTEPRQLDAAQEAMLENFAAMVVDELELRRTAKTLETSQLALREKEDLLQKRELALQGSETTLHSMGSALHNMGSTLRQALRENSQLSVAVGSLTSGVTITDPNLPDNPIIFANPGFCAMTGYTYQEVIGHNCRFLQGADTSPEIIQEIRRAIAEERPFQGVLLNYDKNGTPFFNELIINPVFDEGGRLLNFIGLQHDVTSRMQSQQLLEQKVQERTAELAESKIEILIRLARAAEYRDDDTGQHTKRVAHMAALIAQTLNWSPERVQMIEQAAPLHDVGKIAISDVILLKHGKLTPEEFGTMQSHAPVGAALLAEGQSEIIQMAERIARSHHERWDGAGYPHGLSGEQIPIEGRILAVADVFDALTHVRPYKGAWTVEEAVAEIQRQSGHQFDPQIVEAFLQLSHRELV